MRIFVYEYTCAAMVGDSACVAALRSEGLAMLAGLVEDLRLIPGWTACTVLAEDVHHERIGSPMLRVPPGGDRHVFHEAADACDGVLLVAPESDEILATRCEWVESLGRPLLGPSSAAVRLTGDKFALASHLHERGIPTPTTWLLASEELPEGLTFPAVCKPRDGAGSVDTFLVHTPRDLIGKVVPGRTILQPWVAGQAASVSFLVGRAGTTSLLPVRQDMERETTTLHYCGGSLPLPDELASRATALARRAVAAVNGLKGYVGVDLVLGEPEDGSEDSVIEINPRLTTSYLGLRVACGANLAEAIVRTALGEQTPRLSWSRRPRRFTADGRVIPGR